MAMIHRTGTRALMQLCCKLNPMCEPIVHRVGGFIPKEFCKLRLVMRGRARRRCGKHCLRRKPGCPITSAAWHSRALRLKLNLNDFDAPLAKPFREFLRSPVVRNQTLDSLERTD